MIGISLAIAIKYFPNQRALLHNWHNKQTGSVIHCCVGAQNCTFQPAVDVELNQPSPNLWRRALGRGENVNVNSYKTSTKSIYNGNHCMNTHVCNGKCPYLLTWSTPNASREVTICLEQLNQKLFSLSIKFRYSLHLFIELILINDAISMQAMID